MLYHELEDGMYSVTSYFFAKVNKLHYVSFRKDRGVDV